MPIHIDAPAPGALFDPADFRVRGWLWLGNQNLRVTTVEALDGTIVLGSGHADDFHERPDVNSEYGLPRGTRTGFEFPARHPTAKPREPFELLVRARLEDGSCTPPLFTRLLAAPPLERHPFQMLCSLLGPNALGLEIGAHTIPVAGLSPYYTDAVADYTGVAGRVDFLADARALPIRDGALDYLCSSHVLEHLPDTIASLHEWHRVLRPGGLLYLVVPDKRYTFDQPRATTPVDHFLHEFHEGTTEADTAAHIDEFVFQTKWSILSPNPAADPAPQQAAARESYLRELSHGRPIDIHYHTFTPDSLQALLRAAGFVGGGSARFKLLAHAERYPPGREDGIGVLLQRTEAMPVAGDSTSTFSLEAPTNGAPPLPLVCPVTLRPLRPADDGRSLAVEGTDLRYSIASGRPALLPPRDHAPVRDWVHRAWRLNARAEAAAVDASVVKTPVRSHLDEPAAGSVVDPLCFYVRGWLWLGATHSSIAAVEAWSGETLIGETAALYLRPDVITAHWLDPNTRTGFELFAHHPTAKPGAKFDITIHARLADGTRTAAVFDTCATAFNRDYRQNHFGVLLDQRTMAIQRRQNIFAVGPSQSEGSGELAQLLRRYLGPPPKRIIDVGCGFGSYGRGLLADGYDWMGAEINAADCAELARLELPHHHVDGRTLPFANASFDAALCLEVLEHIDEPHAFISEIQRVAPLQLIVSVPNCELLGYLWDHLATPWHMLEATHTNFFTRWSLGTLLREFYPRVELRFHTPYPLRTVEGTPLYYNLLAIATAER
jgi:SAM-dependent methyltransferase